MYERASRAPFPLSHQNQFQGKALATACLVAEGWPGGATAESTDAQETSLASFHAWPAEV